MSVGDMAVEEDGSPMWRVE